MHPFGATRPPRLALGLGLAGLIPFVTGALGLWLTPEAWRDRVLEELLAYAAIILAFMGAIHWGLAMRAEENSDKAPVQLGLSVIPPLLGWVALALPNVLGRGLFAAGCLAGNAGGGLRLTVSGDGRAGQGVIK